MFGYLKGGLGNQLFQYATYRALALRNDARLVLDVATLFARDRRYRRAFELDAFALPGDVEVRRGRDRAFRLRRNVSRWFESGRKPFMRRYVSEPDSSGFSPELCSLEVSGTVRFSGYWQCADYFDDCAERLRRELAFRDDVATRNAELAKQLAEGSSVAVHVRRVQYDSRLSPAYYDVAIDRLARELPDARFYCFSDDPKWCEKTLATRCPITVVDNTDLGSLEDFRLMARCRHFVIANSSYSWWAAWLGTRPDTRVLAPPASVWANPASVLSRWEVVEPDRAFGGAAP